MLKVAEVRRWESKGVGREFEEILNENNIDYKVVFEELEVFKLVTLGYQGGQRYKVYEYVNSNGQRVLVADTVIGNVDSVTEEILLIPLENNQKYTAEEVAEAIRRFLDEELKRFMGLMPPVREDFASTGELEKEFNLPAGTIRRDIHRRKFYDYEYTKVGRNWHVSREAVKRLYKKEG